MLQILLLFLLLLMLLFFNVSKSYKGQRNNMKLSTNPEQDILFDQMVQYSI